MSTVLAVYLPSVSATLTLSSMYSCIAACYEVGWRAGPCRARAVDSSRWPPSYALSHASRFSASSLRQRRSATTWRDHPLITYM